MVFTHMSKTKVNRCAVARCSLHHIGHNSRYVYLGFVGLLWLDLVIFLCVFPTTVECFSCPRVHDLIIVLISMAGLTNTIFCRDIFYRGLIIEVLR
jgi:hypothetical protein